MKVQSAKSHNKNAAITGVFFIIATVAAIIGGTLYDPLLNHSDYLVSGAKHSTQIVLGAIFELLLACSAAGTAIMLFPYLKQFNENLGLGYVCFRMLEVIFILIGIISILSLLSLSNQYVSQIGQNVTPPLTIAELLKSIHGWSFILGPHFMLGINTFIYSFVFYQSKLVPRKISIIGIMGAVLIFIVSQLEMFGVISQFSVQTVIMALPIAIYEMVLAIWLIIKGFNV